MKQKYSRILFAVSSLIVLQHSVHAQSGKQNPITTAVPFLRISADARTAGMGDASVATTPDANSSFYNGAKTGFNEKDYGIGLTYTPWLQNLRVANAYLLAAAGFYKLSDMDAVSFGVRNFSMGNFVFTDNSGQEIKTFKPMDLAIEAGYSRKLSQKMGVGLSVRYISSKLADNSIISDYKKGNSVAADISLFYKATSGWNFGAAFTNLGGKINYGGKDNFIPANISLGTAYNKKINEDHKISFALDLSKLMVPTPPDPADPEKVAAYENKGVVSSWFSSYGDAPGGFKEEIKEVQVAVGSEYWYKDVFALRAGYFHEDKLKGNRNYFTLGAGLGYKVAMFNFSYLVPAGNNVDNNPLKNTFRLSLLFGAGKMSSK